MYAAGGSLGSLTLDHCTISGNISSGVGIRLNGGGLLIERGDVHADRLHDLGDSATGGGKKGAGCSDELGGYS